MAGKSMRVSQAEQFEVYAENAFNALKNFIQSGDKKAKKEYLDIMGEYAENDKFWNSYESLMEKNSEVKDIRDAYIESVKSKSSHTPKVITPENFCDAIEEVKSAKTVSKIAEMKKKYGEEFVGAVRQYAGMDLLGMVPKKKEDYRKELEESLLTVELMETLGNSLREGNWKKFSENRNEMLKKVKGLDDKELKRTLESLDYDNPIRMLWCISQTKENFTRFLTNLKEEHFIDEQNVSVFFRDLDIVSSVLPSLSVKYVHESASDIFKRVETLRSFIFKVVSRGEKSDEEKAKEYYEGCALYTLSFLMIGWKSTDPLAEMKGRIKTSSPDGLSFLTDYLKTLDTVYTEKQNVVGINNIGNNEALKNSYSRILNALYKQFGASHLASIFSMVTGVPSNYVKYEVRGDEVDVTNVSDVTATVYYLNSQQQMLKSELDTSSATQAKVMSGAPTTTTQIEVDKSKLEIDELYQNLDQQSAVKLAATFKLMEQSHLTTSTKQLIFHTMRLVQRYDITLLPHYLDTVNDILARTLNDKDSSFAFGLINMHLESLIGGAVLELPEEITKGSAGGLKAAGGDQALLSHDNLVSMEKRAQLIKAFSLISNGLDTLKRGLNRYTLLEEISPEKLLTDNMETMDVIVKHTGAFNVMQEMLNMPRARLYVYNYLTILGAYEYPIFKETPSQPIGRPIGEFMQTITPDMIFERVNQLLNFAEMAPILPDITYARHFPLDQLAALINKAFMLDNFLYSGLTSLDLFGAAGRYYEGKQLEGGAGEFLAASGPQSYLRQALMVGATEQDKNLAPIIETVAEGGGIQLAKNVAGIDHARTYFYGDFQDPYTITSITDVRLAAFAQQARERKVDFIVAGRYYNVANDEYGEVNLWAIRKDGTIQEIHFKDYPNGSVVQKYFGERLNIIEGKVVEGAKLRRGPEDKNAYGVFAAWDASSLFNALEQNKKEISTAMIYSKIEDQTLTYYKYRGIEREWGGMGGISFNANHAAAVAYSGYDGSVKEKDTNKTKHFIRTYYFYFDSETAAKAYAGTGTAKAAKGFKPEGLFGGIEMDSTTRYVAALFNLGTREDVANFRPKKKWVTSEELLNAYIDYFVDTHFKGAIPGLSEENKALVRFMLLREVIQKMEGPDDVLPWLLQLMYRHDDFSAGAIVQDPFLYGIAVCMKELNDPRLNENQKTAIRNELVEYIKNNIKSYDALFAIGQNGKWYIYGGLEDEQRLIRNMEVSGIKINQKGLSWGGTYRYDLIDKETGLELAQITGILGEKGEWRTEVTITSKESMIPVSDPNGVMGKLLLKLSESWLMSAAGGFAKMSDEDKRWQGEVILAYRVGEATLFFGANLAAKKPGGGYVVRQLDPDEVKPKKIKNLVILDVPLGVTWRRDEGGKLTFVLDMAPQIESPLPTGVQTTLRYYGRNWSYGAAFGRQVPQGMRPDLRIQSAFLTNADVLPLIIDFFVTYRKGAAGK